MTETEILSLLKESWVGATVRSSTWLFGLGETIHFIGICLLLGAMLVVDLRLMGFLRPIPMRAALAFLPLAIVGFVLVLITGIEFFVADPFLYWTNPAFKLKLCVILLAGINAIGFRLLEHKHALTLADDEIPGAFTRVSAGLSLGAWFFVIVIGRLLPMFEGSHGFF